MPAKQTRFLLVRVLGAALLLPTAVGATELDKPSPLTDAASRERACEKHQQPEPGKRPQAVMFEKVKGASPTTRLPDTARLEARGGVFL
jgi:hypothetical protein